MIKNFMIVVLLWTVIFLMSGCCTYVKQVDLDNGVDKAKVEKEYHKCLASEFMTTLKFWVGMQR